MMEIGLGLRGETDFEGDLECEGLRFPFFFAEKSN